MKIDINIEDKQSRTELLRLIQANIYKAQVNLGVSKTLGNFVQVKKQRELIESLKKDYLKIEEGHW